MTTPVEVNPLLMNSNATTYTVGNSLRFRSVSSAYLNRTLTSNNPYTYTFSAWIKRGTLGTQQSFFGCGNGISTDVSWYGFLSDTLVIALSDGASFLQTTQVFRDPSSWYHIVIATDTPQATASNRLRLYVNGVQVTFFTTANYPVQNVGYQINGTIQHFFGVRYRTSFDSYFDGYMAEVNFIDGQALTPSSFGAYDATTGVWQPKKYTGTYGTNGFYLPFSNNSSVSNLGLDFSGNGNNWTTNNISLTAGDTYDSMKDSPTPTASGATPVGNYAILNPLNCSNANTLRYANLFMQPGASNAYDTVIASIGQQSGKYYFEYYYLNASTPASNSSIVGVTRGQLVASSTNRGQADNNDGIGFAIFQGAAGGTIYTNGATSSTAWQGSVPVGSYVMVAVDCDNQTLFFGVDGTWRNSSNPATNTNGISLPSGGGTWAPFISAFRNTANGSIQQTINFGQQPFQYTPPAGFKSLCTSNLPTPSIVNGATAMAATLYTGTGAVANINNGTNTTIGTTFQPDLVWIKSRSNATNNNLFNSVQGVGLYLVSNNTNGVITDANTLTSFASNGFSLGSDVSSAGVNISGNTYVGWSWKGGGAAVTNTAGSITSQVSANPTAGISVVTFTTTGSTATVGHGLGAVPKMMIAKQPVAASVWPVYHVSIGATNRLVLNDTSAATADTSWGNTTPTSTVFTQNITAAIRTPVVFCFAEVPGFSAFGSYTGNGSTDGPFIYTGFRPRWIMWKRANASVGGWIIEDTSRGTYNVMGPEISAESAGVEATVTRCDFLSNGFKLRAANSGDNASGGTYIYAAFAENPFKYALAR